MPFVICALPTVVGPTLNQSLRALRMYLACRYKLEISRIGSYKVVGACSDD